MNKLFVIDDDIYICELVCDIFDDESTIVTVAHDFNDECISLLEESTPNVILLDINLPSKNGFDIAEEILQTCEYAKIIFISGLASQKDKEQAYNVGGFDYIDKPFDPGFLKAKVENAAIASHKDQENSESLNSVRSSMFQAMTQAAELGALLRFTDEANQCKTIDQLAEMLFSLLEEMDLHTSLSIIDNKGKQIVFYNDKIERPLEREILETARHAGRLIDFGSRTMVNDQNVSLLIRNMPEDEIRYGMIKDNICFVIASIQTKIQNLWLEESLKYKEEMIKVSNNVIAKIMQSLEENSLSFTAQSTRLLEDMTADIQAEFTSLSITEGEEQRIMDLLTSCSDALHALFTQNNSVDTNTRAILSELIKSHSNS